MVYYSRGYGGFTLTPEQVASLGELRARQASENIT